MADLLFHKIPRALIPRGEKPRHRGKIMKRELEPTGAVGIFLI
jgi:hypothetical protein